MNVMRRKKNACDLWNVAGDFGKFSGEVVFDDNGFYVDNQKIRICSTVTKHENGVVVRCGKIKNISDSDVTITALSSKFSLDGGEYEIYTQYNGWQNESSGGWQSLITSVSARSPSVRNAFEASPFMAVWNMQTSRGVAFHLNAYSKWEMRISRCYAGEEASYAEVELGIMPEDFSYILGSGEEIELPEIIYYNFFNKTDMDCWRLHSYLNCHYPRKAMPVIYNTWLFRFDRITYENVVSQIKRAAELGVEYFVIDAGWFGKGSGWFRSRGDWSENMSFGFKGRMKEVAEEVRKHGMKFGFWLEPECASVDSDIVSQKPEYFLEGSSYFIDFANKEACDYIYDKVCELIDLYGAEFVKFDFNADLKYDRTNSAFIKYCKGHKEFIQKIKAKYPDLYIENCASGGCRMAVRDGLLYDSFWLSDNQSPYHGMRIFKDTILRMPPQWIECWASICSAKEITPVYGSDSQGSKIIACNDAVWNGVVGVQQSFLEGFLTGSPVGLSFDLNSLTDEIFDNLKSFIAKFKENRSFWQNAVCHILTDTETMLVLEFRNEDFSHIELAVFAKKAVQDNICVYPHLKTDCNYEITGEGIRSGTDITENGIDFPITVCYTTHFKTLSRCVSIRTA